MTSDCDSKCPKNLQIDWWEIPPYIYKDETNNEVSGIFPDILKKLVHECCDPSANVSCVKLNYSAVASNDSEVVKKHIKMNGIYNGTGVNPGQLCYLYNRLMVRPGYQGRDKSGKGRQKCYVPYLITKINLVEEVIYFSETE